MLNAISELPQRNLKNCPCFKDVNWQAVEDVQALEHDISDEDLLKIVQGMFDETAAADQFIGIHDNEETESELSMEEVLEMVEQNGHILAKPPDDFDVKVFLMSSKGATFTDDEGNFGNLKNKAVDSAIADVDQFSGLVQIVWFKIFSPSAETSERKHCRRQFFGKKLKELYQQAIDISRSADFRGWLKECFQIPENQNLSPAEISIGFDIVLGVFQNSLYIVGDAVQQRSHDDMVSTLNVKDMDEAGLGKVRFVGAWAISRVLKRAKKYARENLYTSCKDTRAQVNKNISKIQALESTVVIPYKILSSETKYPETLNVTESRQYRTQGLIHVSDEFYTFVLELEQKRIQGLNTTMLKKHGDTLIEVVESTLLNDKQLKSIWKGLFTKVEVAVRLLIIIIIVTKSIKL